MISSTRDTSSHGTMASKARFGRMRIRSWKNAYSASWKRTSVQAETSPRPRLHSRRRRFSDERASAPGRPNWFEVECLNFGATLLLQRLQFHVREHDSLERRGDVRRHAQAHVCRVLDPHIFDWAHLFQFPSSFAGVHREAAALADEAQARGALNVDEHLVGALI